MPPQNELQAMFPADSRVVRNPHGTAPGIDLEVPRDGRSSCRVMCLPGVPAEMVEMWHDSVAATLGSLGGSRRIICRRRINCFGAGESQIEAMLPDLIRRGRRPTVGINASKTTIILRIAADGRTEEECHAAIEPTVATIRQCLGTLVFGEEDEELQHAVIRLLRDRKKTLATVECGTAGLLAQWLAAVEHSADAYRGGTVLTKTTESADAMATHCRAQHGTDYALAVGPILPSPIPKEVEGGRSKNLPSPCGRGVGGEGRAMCENATLNQHDAPQSLTIALASADGVHQETIPIRWHPVLSRVYCAKHALNATRLALLP